MRHHGTRSKYIHEHCRCNLCVEVAKLYRNAQRLRTGKVKSHRVIKETKIKYCKHCVKEFTGKDPKIFCSLICSSDYTKEESEREIIEANDAVGRSLPAVRRTIKKLRGNSCSICNITEWLGQPVLLILDHIDGNSGNWKLDNLRLICSNCDTQTTTYKGKNRGNGRYNRKMRYREGKSF